MHSVLRPVTSCFGRVWAAHQSGLALVLRCTAQRALNQVFCGVSTLSYVADAPEFLYAPHALFPTTPLSGRQLYVSSSTQAGSSRKEGKETLTSVRLESALVAVPA
jgi:hypothetical protein